MMYVLTQEELDKLVPKKELDAANAGLDWIRNNFASKCPHNPSPPPGRLYDYCSECPLSHIGMRHQPPEQRPRPPREISKAICPLRREYPK